MPEPKSNKRKKVVDCPCGAKDVELVRDDDGDWQGGCSECGRNLGRAATRAEVTADTSFFGKPAEPPKKEKKSWLE